MPIKVKRLYLETIRERYKNAPKSEKSKILDEYCFVCKYERKYAIRILNRHIEPRLNRPGPKATYGSVVVEHLRKLWESMNKACSKNMKRALPLWLEFYDCDDHSRRLLLTVSPSTIDRLLKPFKKVRGISTTQASMIKNRIPIKLLDGSIDRPGFVEADTVAHCGETTAGTYASSLTITDLHSGWTENRAAVGKSADAILKAIRSIEARLPFILQGFATDNGTEFLNAQLEEYLQQRLKPVEFVRRRPYKKNDNAHVEQKNFTHVRELFGYERIEDADLVAMMNEIYQAYWNPLRNYFMPQMKLASKVREGSKIKKKYDEPRTPYQRIIENIHTPLHVKRRLKEEFKCKNPFFLKAELDKKLKIFFEAVDRCKRQRRLTGS